MKRRHPFRRYEEISYEWETACINKKTTSWNPGFHRPDLTDHQCEAVTIRIKEVGPEVAALLRAARKVTVTSDVTDAYMDTEEGRQVVAAYRDFMRDVK